MVFFALLTFIALKFFNMLQISFWSTSLSQGEQINENWIKALNIWLGDYGVDAIDIPNLGFRDLAKLGRKLASKGCHFWGSNLITYSEVVRAYEQKTENPMALPIFGGLVQKFATKGGFTYWRKLRKISVPSAKSGNHASSNKVMNYRTCALNTKKGRASYTKSW